MKKIKKFFKGLWLERHDILKILAYALAVAWYGYTLRIIAEAEIGIFPTILLFIGGLILGFFTCISLHEAFSYDDE